MQKSDIEIWNSDHSRYSFLVDQVVQNPAKMDHALEAFGRFNHPVSDCFNEAIDVLKGYFDEFDWSTLKGQCQHSTLHEIQLDLIENIAIILERSEFVTEAHRMLSHTLKWSINNHRDRIRRERSHV